MLTPEDRKTQGLVLGLPAYDNINLTALGRAATLKTVLRRARELDRAQRLATRVRLQEGVLRRPTRFLSGGNQQKVVLAKWIDTVARVLLVDEPTRGIDVGAKAEIFSLLDELASAGLAVVMVSSELEEVVEQSDRILALSRGTVAEEFSHPGVSQAAVMSALVEER